MYIHTNIEIMKDCIDTLLKSRYKSRPNPNSSYLLPSTPCSTRPISQLFLPSWASGCESNMYVEQENWGLVKEGKKLMPEAKSYRWKHLNWTYTTTLKDWETKRLNQHTVEENTIQISTCPKLPSTSSPNAPWILLHIQSPNSFCQTELRAVRDLCV